MASRQLPSPNGVRQKNLVALSTRIPKDLHEQLIALTPRGSTPAATAREMLHRSVFREQVLFELFAQALEDMRTWHATVLRTVLLNLGDGLTASDVRAAIEQLEAEGLI